MNSVITDSGNGMAPNKRQAITWTNADLLSAVKSESKQKISVSIKVMHLKMSSEKWRQFCPGINVDDWQTVVLFQTYIAGR